MAYNWTESQSILFLVSRCHNVRSQLIDVCVMSWVNQLISPHKRDVEDAAADQDV
jgi:hypothetical protein